MLHHHLHTITLVGAVSDLFLITSTTTPHYQVQDFKFSVKITISSMSNLVACAIIQLLCHFV